MSNLTQVQCRTLLENDQKFQTSVGDFDADVFADVLDEVEDALYDLLIQANPTQYLVEQAVSTAVNPTTIATAYRFDVFGGGIFDANADGSITDRKFNKTRRGSSASGYHIASVAAEGGVKVHWTPATAATATKWAVFIPLRTVQTTDTTATIFPLRKKSFVKRALIRAYFIWDRNAGLNTADAEFQNALRNIVHNSNPDPEAASLDLGSF